jgi:hypothetical protein
MPAEPGDFQLFYDGSFQHPMLLWLVASGALLYCLRVRGLQPRMRIYCFALAFLSLLDAWLTSNSIAGVGRLPAAVSGVLPLCFVLAGDFRYFLLVRLATPSGDLDFTPTRLLAAVGLTAIVPVASQVLLLLLPASWDSPRTLYLVYELLFVVLTFCLLRFAKVLRDVPWLRRVSYFVMLYYGLWASADLIILATGSDLGFALRVVPNVLYYGGLIVMVGREAARAAETARSGGAPPPDGGQP